MYLHIKVLISMSNNIQDVSGYDNSKTEASGLGPKDTKLTARCIHTTDLEFLPKIIYIGYDPDTIFLDLRPEEKVMATVTQK